MKKFIKKIVRKYQKKIICFITALIICAVVYTLNMFGIINIKFNLNNFSAYSNESSGHKHNEAAYQEVWCMAHNGITEYKNRDYTRVDCLTKDNAVEFDFAKKWAESIGQALHYQLMTGKRGKVVLILENPTDKSTYYTRVEALAKKYDFDVEYMMPDDLHLNQNGECPVKKCKCHKRN